MINRKKIKNIINSEKQIKNTSLLKFGNVAFATKYGKTPIINILLFSGIIKKSIKNNLLFRLNKTKKIKENNLSLTYINFRNNLYITSFKNYGSNINSKKDILKLFNKIKETAKKENKKKIICNTWIFLENPNLMEFTKFKRINYFLDNLLLKLKFKKNMKNNLEKTLEKENTKIIKGYNFNKNELIIINKNNIQKKIKLDKFKTLPTYVLEIN